MLNLNLRTIVVEDSPTMARLTTRSLQMMGIEPMVAHNGQNALEIILESQPDLLLLDVYLPDMTGWDILEIVRQRYGDAVRIVIMTSDDAATHVAKSVLTPLDRCLIKPVMPDALINEIEKMYVCEQGA